MKKDPYVVLGVRRNAGLDDIKHAYRRAAKRSHPDLSSEKDGGRFKEVRNAYDILTDKNRRKACDEMLDRQQAAVQKRRRRAGPQTTAGPVGEMIRPAAPAPGPVPGKSPYPEIGLEIRLSPGEAKTGGDFPIRLPVDRRCPECGGVFPWAISCPVCGGAGGLRQVEAFFLRLPPGIADGDRARILLGGAGAGASVLHLVFRIDPRAA